MFLRISDLEIFITGSKQVVHYSNDPYYLTLTLTLTLTPNPNPNPNPNIKKICVFLRISDLEIFITGSKQVVHYSNDPYYLTLTLTLTLTLI